MTTPSGELFGEGHVELDGVIYELLVIRSDDGYHGGWVCLHCNELCSLETPSPTSDEAAQGARASLDAHHRRVHV